jgi:hypothetical protein
MPLNSLANNLAAAQIELEDENSPKQGVFARFEQKYFLSAQYAARFKSELAQYMNPSYPSPETHFTGIESVYFDSDDLHIYRMHFAGQTERFKIRLRRYAPNGIVDDGTVHVELKSKAEGVSRKNRFQIGPKDLGILLSGCQIPLSSSELSAYNRDLKARELKERVERINELVQENTLLPSCRVRYRREAFERENLRLTIDDQINFESLRSFSGTQTLFQSDSKLSASASRMCSAFNKSECLLVEVKHSGFVPSWLVAILQANNCSKAKFSKYCYSVTEQILGD